MTEKAHPHTQHNGRNLLAVLNSELSAGRELNRVVHAQTDALVRNDMRDFEELETQARHTMARLELLDAQRQDRARKLGQQLQVPVLEDSEVSLRELASYMDSCEARQLLRTRQKLLAVNQEIRETVARNRSLLENARDVVRVSLDILAQMAMAPAKYGTNPDALNAPTFYIDRRA